MAHILDRFHRTYSVFISIRCSSTDTEQVDFIPITAYTMNEPNWMRNTHTRGPFYEHGLTLIPIRISKHMPSEVWKITYPFPNFSDVAVKIGNGEVISSHTL